MARNGSGTHTVPNTFVSGQPITAAGHNQNWTDVAAEITNSVAADGQTTISGALKGASGTVSLPSYSFSADLDTGMYRIGANSVGFAANGAKVIEYNTAGAVVTGSLTITNGFSVSAGAVDFPAGSIPIADIANQTANRLIGTSGAGVLGPATISAGLAYSSSALSLDVNGLSEDATPDGAADFWLMYDTSAGAPKKVKPSSIGLPGKVLLATQSASASATIDFTTNLSDAYDGYEIAFDGVKPATDDVGLWLRVGTGGGPTYQTSGYKWLQNQFITGTGINAIGDNAAGQMVLTNSGGGGSGVGNASGEHVSGSIKFSNPDASDFPMFNIETRWRCANGNLGAVNEVAEYSTAGAITGLRLMFSSGNIASGRFVLYGMRKAAT
jgi:hypothetical protein